MENQEQYTEYQMKLMNLAKHFAGKNIDIDNCEDDEMTTRAKELESDFVERCRKSGTLAEYGAAEVRKTAKEHAVASIYIQENAAMDNAKRATRQELEDYTERYRTNLTNDWLTEQRKKFPVHVRNVLNIIANYKDYYEKLTKAQKPYQKIMYREGVDACYVNMKKCLKTSEKFAQIKTEDRFIDLELPRVVVDYVNDYIDHYKEAFSGKCGKRERKQYIEVIDCETNMIVHTFVLRSDIVNTFGITKGTLSKVLKSAKENPLTKHTWKKVKYKDKKYWLCEKVTE